MFVEARAYSGHYLLNPYAFKRRWDYSDAIIPPDNHVPDLLREEEQSPGGDDDSDHQSEEEMTSLPSKTSKGKGKGKGKGLRARFQQWRESRRSRNEEDPPPPYPGTSRPGDRPDNPQGADQLETTPTHFYIK